jgi:CelD/BcsL family acetyltransferase involved in cellulose biosynthesis
LTTLEHHSTFATVRDEWNDLARAVDAPPFLRAAWFETWWKAFGSGSLDIVALRRDRRLAAVLPLARRRGVLRSLSNWHQPEFGSVAQDAAARQALADALLQESRAPIALRLIDARGDDAEALRAAGRAAGRAGGARLQSRVQLQSPYLDIDGDWDGYRTRVAGDTYRNIRRRHRRLSEQGAVVTRIEDRWERLDDALRAGFRLEGSGWKRDEGTAITSDPATQRFYTEIARWAADHGWLRMAWLDVDVTPIAWDMMLEHARVMYTLKGGYDTSYRSFGPGHLLTLEVVSHCFADGVRRLDFLGGTSQYKRMWTDTARDMAEIDFFPRSTAGAVGLVSYRYGRRVAKRARAYAISDNAPWRRFGGRRGARA